MGSGFTDFYECTSLTGYTIANPYNTVGSIGSTITVTPAWGGSSQAWSNGAFDSVATIATDTWQASPAPTKVKSDNEAWLDRRIGEVRVSL